MVFIGGNLDVTLARKFPRHRYGYYIWIKTNFGGKFVVKIEDVRVKIKMKTLN